MTTSSRAERERFRFKSTSVGRASIPAILLQDKPGIPAVSGIEASAGLIHGPDCTAEERSILRCEAGVTGAPYQRAQYERVLCVWSSVRLKVARVEQVDGEEQHPDDVDHRVDHHQRTGCAGRAEGRGIQSQLAQKRRLQQVGGALPRRFTRYEQADHDSRVDGRLVAQHRADFTHRATRYRPIHHSKPFGAWEKASGRRMASASPPRAGASPHSFTSKCCGALGRAR